MKKTIFFYIAVLAISVTACTKENDGLKEQIETTLPGIEITSMGLLAQVGPFVTSDAIQVTFGGAITQNNPGVFDIAWYDAPATGAATRIDSVHFDDWNEEAKTATANNSITTSLSQTTYPNTYTISGNLVLKLAKLPAGNKSYTLRLYARTLDGKVANVSVSKFITMK